MEALVWAVSVFYCGCSGIGLTRGLRLWDRRFVGLCGVCTRCSIMYVVCTIYCVCGVCSVYYILWGLKVSVVWEWRERREKVELVGSCGGVCGVTWNIYIFTTRAHTYDWKNFPYSKNCIFIRGFRCNWNCYNRGFSQIVPIKKIMGIFFWKEWGVLLGKNSQFMHE